MSSHPFSKADVEAAMLAFAAKQFHEGMTDNNPFASAMNAALSAAFDHARGEGRVRDGNGYNLERDIPPSDWAIWTEKKPSFHDECFPVTIIKDARE